MYAQEILDLLAQHFGDYNLNSNIGKLLQVLGTGDDEFLQTCEDVKKVTDIDHATGKNLDFVHGINKDLKRGSFTDQEYRERLKLETSVNNSDGNIDTLSNAASTIFGNDFKGITEDLDAGIEITLNFIDTQLPNSTFERAVTAGVSTVYSLIAETETIDVVETDAFSYDMIYLETGVHQTGSQMGVLL